MLVTGATGGVGDFAVQLARLAGAHVTASVRRADQVPTVRQLGAHDVVVGDTIAASPKYDVIIESVGGKTLGTALAALQRGSVCVTLGVSASSEVTFDARDFFVTGRSTLYGFYLFTEFVGEPASVGLRRLADLVAAGQLAPHISLERPWKEIAQVAQDLMARRFPGKAVRAPASVSASPRRFMVPGRGSLSATCESRGWRRPPRSSAAPSACSRMPSMSETASRSMLSCRPPSAPSGR